MPYCVNCGVELESGAKSCPLCLSPVILPDCGGQVPPKHAHPVLDPEDKENFTASEGHLMVWELLSVSFGIAALAVSVVDLAESSGLQWSLYPLASIALAWILLTILLRARGPSLLAISLAALSIPAYLLVLDLLRDGLGWFLTLGLPISLSAELIVGLSALAIARSSRLGANVAAIGLAAVAALCLSIEASIDLATMGRLSLGWSSIVLAALLPVSLFLFYLHYRILGKRSLRRFFHL